MFSKRFKIISLLSILLNILHGVEVSQTHFYVSNPNFYPYTKLFNSIPEAVYYVQHGFLYVALIVSFFFILGGKWRFIPLCLYGMLLLSETHHFISSILSMSYQSGMITSGLFIIMSYIYLKELYKEFKYGK
jgi:hypothetical protein